jgi:hypothetical protein
MLSGPFPPNHRISPKPNTVSLRTLERYLKLYYEGGLETLKPSQKERASRIPVDYLEQAALLRRENPKRSILTIISMLEKSGPTVPQSHALFM